MKNLITITALSFLIIGSLFAQNTEEMPKTITPTASDDLSRFRIYEAKTGLATFVIKLDTQTGKTWFLQPANNEDLKIGIQMVWSEIPEFNLTPSSAPAKFLANPHTTEKLVK